MTDFDQIPGTMIGMQRQFDMRCADVPACRIKTGCQRLSGITADIRIIVFFYWDLVKLANN